MSVGHCVDQLENCQRAARDWHRPAPHPGHDARVRVRARVLPADVLDPERHGNGASGAPHALGGSCVVHLHDVTCAEAHASRGRPAWTGRADQDGRRDRRRVDLVVCRLGIRARGHTPDDGARDGVLRHLHAVRGRPTAFSILVLRRSAAEYIHVEADRHAARPAAPEWLGIHRAVLERNDAGVGAGRGWSDAELSASHLLVVRDRRVERRVRDLRRR